MGEATDAQVKVIRDTRDRLDAEVNELQRALPAPVVLGKRLLGAAIAMSGLIMTVVVWARRRRDGSRLKRIDKRLKSIEDHMALSTDGASQPR